MIKRIKVHHFESISVACLTLNYCLLLLLLLFSLMLLGPTTAGKSSMMKSLTEGTAVLVHIDDRTQVADIQTWDITPGDSIQIFDHGGHDIYRITSPIFFVPNGTIALIHDISQVSKDRVDDTTAILRQALTYHPENQVLLVLTHTDLVSTEVAQKNKNLIKSKVHAYIDQEIQSLKFQRDEGEKKCRLLSQLQKQKENMEAFLLSSKTYAGMENLIEFLRKEKTQKMVSLPEKWVQFYKLMLKEKKNFFMVTELHQLFKSLFLKVRQAFQQPEIKKQFTSALEYYRATGHVLHFPDNPFLEDYVFHNKDFILQIMQSVFHHNFKPTDFSNLCQSDNLSVDLMLQYDKEGLLAIQVLQLLWQNYRLKEEEERAVLEIMKKFHICYPVDSSEKLFFFPFLLKSNEPPTSLDLHKQDSAYENYFSVYLDCVFHNAVPINTFEALQVQIQKTATENNYGGRRHAWQDGIEVKIGTLEIRAIRRASESTIRLCVCSLSEDVEQVWEVTTHICSDLEAVLQPMMGVIWKFFFKCTHCILKGVQPVQERSVNEVLKVKGPDVTYDSCKGDKIPRALVIAPSGELVK